MVWRQLLVTCVHISPNGFKYTQNESEISFGNRRYLAVSISNVLYLKSCSLCDVVSQKPILLWHVILGAGFTPIHEWLRSQWPATTCDSAPSSSRTASSEKALSEFRKAIRVETLYFHLPHKMSKCGKACKYLVRVVLSKLLRICIVLFSVHISPLDVSWAQCGLSHLPSLPLYQTMKFPTNSTEMKEVGSYGSGVLTRR